MKLPVAWMSCGLLCIAAGSALAQRPASAVQLPTFSSFSGSTTVTVPDRGSVFLGGIKRAASGRNEFGVPLLPFRPFRNTAIGRELSASNMFVTATIHDLQAMDEFLLSQPTSFRSAQLRPPAGSVLGKTVRSGQNAVGPGWKPQSLADSASRPTISVAEAQAWRLRQQATRATEAVDFFQRGQKAEAAGKTGAARIYYQMASRRATGELKDQIVARLEAIAQAETASKLVQTRP